MRKLQELTRYDFHDSLLEKITYEKKNKRLILEIDFCNWKQEWYAERDDETLIIFLIFENVLDCKIPECIFDSDEIIKFELINDNQVNISVFNDSKGVYYEIIITALGFSIEKQMK